MKVLIADDDPVILQQLQTLLQKWQYEPEVYKDGLAAWESIQQKDSPPLLLLDWEMPGMKGLDICYQVRKLSKEPTPYILLLTAKDDKKSIIKGIEAGADDYITKPFYPHELKVRLESGVRILRLQQHLLEVRDQLKIEATYDPLTEILNRRALMKSLKRELERSFRQKKAISIAILDIDHFKKVNDTYGHLVGDTVLQQTVKRIKSILRPYDTLGRYGGEEFVLLLPGVDFGTADGFFKRVKNKISEKPFQFPEGSIEMTVSQGVCVFCSNARPEVDEVIKIADQALYKAKERGRDCVVTELFKKPCNY